MNNKIDAIKTRIEQKMRCKEELRIEYENAVAAMDGEINALKIELADMILNGCGESEEKRMYTIVSVVFKKDGKPYDYQWVGEGEIRVGNMVEVVGRFDGERHPVEVVGVKQIPFEEMDFDFYEPAYPLSEG